MSGPKTKKYLKGLIVVTVSSRTKPKQVREEFVVNGSLKDAVNIAIARA